MGTAAQQVTGTTQTIYSANICGDLIVTACSWSKATTEKYGIDAIIAGEIAAEEWTATEDGRGVKAEWATGQEYAGEGWIYYERSNGRHGWVGEKSRKIVQTG
jgi:hypothetical protein